MVSWCGMRRGTGHSIRVRDPRVRVQAETHGIDEHDEMTVWLKQMMTRWRLAVGLLSATLACVLSGCGPLGADGDGDLRPRVAVSNSYLEAAVRDLLGDDVGLLRLAEPGTCPGHFDLRPSQVRALRNCRLLIRFDFQEGIDARMQGIGGGRPMIAVVTASGGLSVPKTYLDTCRQVGLALIDAGLLDVEGLDLRQTEIAARLEQLGKTLRARMAANGAGGLPVVVSGRQEEFCAWLGFDVVGTFGAMHSARPSDVDRVIEAGERREARLVIANEPEGTRLAEALADRFRVEMIVLANFPSFTDGALAFDRMVERNVDRLEAWEQ